MIKVLQEWDENVIQGLIELTVKFCSESDYEWPVSVKNTRKTFWQLMHADEWEVIYWESDGIIKGAATVCKTNEFHENYIGYIHKFYVAPEYRKSKVGLGLMIRCARWFDDNNCSLSFVTLTANIGRDAAFKKLLQRFGYTSQGECMGRMLNG